MRIKIVPEMQRRVLRHLRAGPSTNAAMVAAGLGPKSSVSRACLSLERYGEVADYLDEKDARVWWYELTDAGRERLAELEGKSKQAP